MLERNKSKIRVLNRFIEDVKVHSKKDKPSTDDLIEFLAQSYDYALYRYDDPTERSFINRVNLLWVWPVYLFCTPFQYLFTGTMGIRRNTKIGEIVNYLVKLI